MTYIEELKEILKNIGMFFKWVLQIIPKLLGLVDIEEQIAFWAITTIIGIIVGFRKKIFK